MKTIYILDLQKNQIITNETFVIVEAKRLEDKNGKAYYNVVLADKTGKIEAKIWNDSFSSIETKAIKEDKVVQVSGKIDEYKGKKQMTIMSLNSVNESSLDEFLESSEFNADEMFKEIEKEISEIKNPKIRKMLESIISDPEIGRKFKYWPAASSVHHDFRSGLIQHVLEMLSISKGLVRFYPLVNYDVLTAGIIMHDLGKVYELDAQGITARYTTIGSLIGHIPMGLQILDRFGKDTLDEKDYLHIAHLILSHHGSKDLGSPVMPSTVEAIMLSTIDLLSSKARTAQKAVDSISDDTEFSSFNQWLGGTRFWKAENSNTGDSEKAKSDKDTDSTSEQLSLE